MKPFALATLFLALAASFVINRVRSDFGLGASDQAGAKTQAVSLNGHTFTLPAGFTIELAAKTPQVDRPIVADFVARNVLLGEPRSSDIFPLCTVR